MDFPNFTVRFHRSYCLDMFAKPSCCLTISFSLILKKKRLRSIAKLVACSSAYTRQCAMYMYTRARHSVAECMLRTVAYPVVYTFYLIPSLHLAI